MTCRGTAWGNGCACGIQFTCPATSALVLPVVLEQLEGAALDDRVRRLRDGYWGMQDRAVVISVLRTLDAREIAALLLDPEALSEACKGALSHWSKVQVGDQDVEAVGALSAGTTMGCLTFVAAWLQFAANISEHLRGTGCFALRQ